MHKIKELRQQKADLVKKNARLLELSESENRDLTTAENAEYEVNKASVTSLNARIKRVEEQMDEERNTPASSLIEVGQNQAEKKPYRSFGEQLQVIARSQQKVAMGQSHLVDPRFAAALGSSETVPSDGGFLVEPEYNSQLMKRVYDTGELAKRCSPLTMNSARMVINAVDEDSRVDGSRWGGILSFWLAESQQYQGTKPKFREVQLVANKLIALIFATEELLEDTSMLESYVDDVVPQEFAFQTDAAIYDGSGAGQPLGFINSPSTLIIPPVSGEASGSGPSTPDVLNMWSRMWAPYRKNAVWLINQSIEPFLYPLTLGAPSLGQILIYTPPGVNGNNSSYGLMFGRPVIPVEQSATVGVQGDITLWSPDGYLLAKKNEIRADSSIHVAFLTGEKAFRFMMRQDGQPWWKKPLQPYFQKGQTPPPTLAPACVLGTRG